MTTEDYRAALLAATREYEAVGDERRRLDERLAQLAQTITTLSRLVGLTPSVPLGLTDACRLALRAGVPMTPIEVRDRLLGIGVDLSIYSNELSAIHTVLKRLNEAGEIRIVPRANGKHAYLWTRPPTAIAIGPEIAEFIRGTGGSHYLRPRAGEDAPEAPDAGGADDDEPDDAPAVRRPRRSRRRGRG
jgi:hypothetical protein